MSKPIIRFNFTMRCEWPLPREATLEPVSVVLSAPDSDGSPAAPPDVLHDAEEIRTLGRGLLVPLLRSSMLAGLFEAVRQHERGACDALDSRGVSKTLRALAAEGWQVDCTGAVVPIVGVVHHYPEGEKIQ